MSKNFHCNDFDVISNHCHCHHNYDTQIHIHNLFTTLLILSGTTQMRHQKRKTRKVKRIWIYWSKR